MLSEQDDELTLSRWRGGNRRREKILHQIYSPVSLCFGLAVEIEESLGRESTMKLEFNKVQ